MRVSPRSRRRSPIADRPAIAWRKATRCGSSRTCCGARAGAPSRRATRARQSPSWSSCRPGASWPPHTPTSPSRARLPRSRTKPWHGAHARSTLRSAWTPPRSPCTHRRRLASASYARGGKARIEQSLARARAAGLDEHAARAYLFLASPAVERRQHDVALRYLDEGIAFCSERGQELYLQYLLAFRGRVELDQGRWAAAAESASSVLRVDRKSITPRILALVVLGLVRARRGDPEYAPLLEEAWLRAYPTGELGRLGWVAAARAEVAWLAGDADGGRLGDRGLPWRSRSTAGGPGWPASSGCGAIALDCRSRSRTSCHGTWPSSWLAMRKRRPRAGRSLAVRTKRPWHSGSRRTSRRCASPSTICNAIEARPAATIVMRRLRERGIRGVPRGPRAATRNNPAQLTPRELEVLALVADGLRDSDIAERLVLSDRTVGHHVSSILSKLGVRTRAEATSRAFRLGMSVPPQRQRSQHEACDPTLCLRCTRVRLTARRTNMAHEERAC